ncbi:MAG: acetolactate synthase I/II/III large subunit [Parcubacteria group bacterium Gr01-1014_18]|nr:MAG: acetolactate synthase I/II/III large subunit [Parcubacteria group bacterium Greene0416_36]TSC80225.1 MAG: acetolactate synthase I/II/III large subunit [Parcubacteria group bacterium Gr01-1014_18]TSC98407.1 MAG: acetolactate synthase I/II/III large subunit [Parcubacteria group bacterium Greene1014_20]TSD06948.1 MAG: acetolactate synthase I/II/III large subunit [Parcubacteria group bacterium Greene0714_2]
MKTSDLFVRALEKEGVKMVFGVPGEENLDFLESLRTSSIKMIITRHEQAAGFMAATVGRLTGTAGVCLSTLGPGATNLVTAAAYAQLGGMPMMMITGQKPIKKSKQGDFQIINTVEMMRPLTKFTRQLISGANVGSSVRRAFKDANQERPGAVHLELPEDIAAEEVEESVEYSASPVRRPVAEEKAIRKAVEMIKQAKSPLICIAAGANRKLVSKMLTEFVEKTKIPFFNTQMGKGVVDERNPLFLGTAAFSDGDFLHCAADRADLIINVGHDVIEKPPFIMRAKDTRRVIHINFSAADVDAIYFPHHEVVGDIANAIWQIKERLSPEKKWDFSYFEKIKTQIENHLAEKENSDSFPILPQRLVQEVRKAVPDDGIVCLDNGMYKLWFARHYKAYSSQTLLLDNALATMGAGLPSSIATKLVFPKKSVVAVCGDGGFMMNSQEMETAMRLGLDLVVLVLNDNAFGMIQWKQKGMGFSDFGLNYGNPDFVKYAESYGASASKLEKRGDLSALIKKAQNQGGVHLIEVPIDYSENDRVFTKELKAKKCPA